MKNLQTPWSDRLIRLFITFIIFLFCIHPLKSQTLFEIAVELDSLYDQVKTDSSAAQPFFDAIQKVYAIEGDFDPAEIRKDVRGNRFLAKIVGLAYQQLNLTKSNQDSSLVRLNTTRDSIFKVCIFLVEKPCYDNPDCPYRDQLGGLTGSAYYGVYYSEDLEALVEKVSKPKEISIQLKKLLLTVTSIDLEIAEINQSNNSQFVQSDQAADIMPVSSAPAATAFAPIIIQNQGGGSAQSAIIDGTAKWIAERMRQELSIAFFDRFETWAEQKSISYLFPNTLSVLQTSANTDYTLMMEVYKNAFDKDLNQIIFNLPIFLEKELVNDVQMDSLLWSMAENQYQQDSLYAAYVRSNQTSYLIAPFETYKLQIEAGDTMVVYKTNEELVAAQSLNFNYDEYSEKINNLYNHAWTQSGVFNDKNTFKYINFTLEAIKQLKDGSHPSSLLTYLSNNVDEIFPHNSELNSALLLLDVLSQGLTKINEEKNTVWIGKQDIQKLRDDAQFRSIFFGLLDYKIKQILRAKKQRIKNLNASYGYAKQEEINRMVFFKKRLIKDFCNYARAPIMKNKTLQKDLLFDWTWGSIIDEYIPSDTSLIGQYDKAQNKSMLSYVLYEYNIGILNDFTLNTFDIEGYQSTMNRLRWDVDNAIDTIRLLSHTNHPSDPSIKFEYAANILRKLYTEPKEYFFGYGYPNEYISIDINDPRNSAFLREAGEPFSWFYKNGEDWSNTIYPLLEQLVDQRAVIYQQYSGYDQAFSKIENQIADRYHTVISNDSIMMQIAHNGSVKEYVLNQLELRSLNTTEYNLSNLILSESPYDQKRFGNIVNNFIQFATKIDNINSELKELRANDKANFGSQEFFYLIKSSVDALDMVLELAIYDQKTYEHIKFITNNILDAYQSGMNKDYNGLVMNIIPVVQKIVTEKYQPQIDSLIQRDLKKHNLTLEQINKLPVSEDRKELKLKLDDKLRKMQEVFKYATFAAAVAESNNSEDVKNAIQAIALPVGSYSIKRRTFSNISLQAYPGITGGFELIQYSDISEWAPNFGFTAPIGIGVNWGYRAKVNSKKYHNNVNYQRRVQRSEKGFDDKIFTGHSGSFFFSFIDLGALVLFRLNDANQPLPEDVGIKQIFSPGASYVHGLPGVPISIMAGFQMTPELRKVGEDTKANSFRFNVSLVVDLPIANFHTRRREKR